MDVSAVSFGSNNDYSSSTNNSQIKQIQNQILKLQQELKTENQSNDDAQTKQMKTQQVQAQIELLQAQLTQLELKNQNKNSAQQSTSNKDTQNLKNNLHMIDIQA
ncbi:FlxA-like family protein [Desulfosporosinus sp. SYSU MS00001]|uniref:FlxA-like family protein n=1 Tax=Desulfosporosinus sp. SYSU MS00001 TaxID=3416284 RepID=UPI003CEA6639